MLKLDVLRVVDREGRHAQSWLSTATPQVRVEKKG